MTDLATLQTRLAEAEAAQHALSTGRHETSVEYDGRRTTFSAARPGELQGYIDGLRAQIAALSGEPARGRRRSLRVTF